MPNMERSFNVLLQRRQQEDKEDPPSDPLPKIYLNNSTASQTAYFNASATADANVPLANATLPTHQQHQHNSMFNFHAFSTPVKVAVFGAVGLIVFLAIISLVLFIYRRRMAAKRPSKDESQKSWQERTLQGDEERIRSAV